MLYEHEQTNRLWIAIAVFLMLPLVVLFVFLARETPAVLVAMTGPVIGGLALFAFSRLHVAVNPTDVRVRWRFGWPARTVLRSDITHVEVVRMSGWYGIGIRAVPKGWMWNVRVGDSVALQLTSGRRFLIGTDDPDGLEAALRL